MDLSDVRLHLFHSSPRQNYISIPYSLLLAWAFLRIRCSDLCSCYAKGRRDWMKCISYPYLFLKSRQFELTYLISGCGLLIMIESHLNNRVNYFHFNLTTWYVSSWPSGGTHMSPKDSSSVYGVSALSQCTILSQNVTLIMIPSWQALLKSYTFWTLLLLILYCNKYCWFNRENMNGNQE